MTERDEKAARLATAAVHLRQAAIQAERPDIVAKADDVIAALRKGDASRRGGNDVGTAILRTLDGLGF